MIQLSLSCHSSMCKHVQWCVGSSTDFGAQVIIKCFLHLITKIDSHSRNNVDFEQKKARMDRFLYNLLMYKINDKKLYFSEKRRHCAIL